MQEMEEYEDALLTLQLCVAMENRVAKLERRIPMPKTKLKACCKAVAERVSSPQVKLVALGIERQTLPQAALTKTVREYHAIMDEIKTKGSVILKFRSDYEKSRVGDR